MHYVAAHKISDVDLGALPSAAYIAADGAVKKPSQTRKTFFAPRDRLLLWNWNYESINNEKTSSVIFIDTHVAE